jgi:TolA-binding protein
MIQCLFPWEFRTFRHVSTMRPTKFRILLPVLLLSFGLVPSALAQRASLADRVAALEAQSTNTQGNTDLLNQVNQLRSELTELRGTVEQLQNENAQLKQRARDQYLDLDGRLGRLEGSAGGIAAAAGRECLGTAGQSGRRRVRGSRAVRAR